LGECLEIDAAAGGVGVAGRGEGGEEDVGGGAAAVVADVDDEAELALGGGEEVALVVPDAGHVHGADVEVAELAAGELVDQGGVAEDLVVVAEVGVGGGGD